MNEAALDRLAIRELVEKYNDAVMRHDGDAWSSTWAEDATWVLPGSGDGISGRVTILSTWQAAMAQFEFVGFFTSAGPIVVDGDAASGTWYQQEVLVTKGVPTRHIIGRYDDTYIRAGDGWLFAKRVYEILRVTEGD